MVAINKIIDGYQRFYKKYFKEDPELYKTLVEIGQSPKTLIIACSDSRVDPSIITSASPGEIFVIRNVANLVPPFQKDSKTYHGTSAALEFAVNILLVENIIILGHTKCAGIQTLAEINKKSNKFSFLNAWVQISTSAWTRVLTKHKDCSHAEKVAFCEKESLITSLDNLMTYPWIKKKQKNKEIELFAWHFDLETGNISSYNVKKKKFEDILKRL